MRHARLSVHKMSAGRTSVIATQWYAIWPKYPIQGSEFRNLRKWTISEFVSCTGILHVIKRHVVKYDTPRPYLSFICADFWYYSLFGVTWPSLTSLLVVLYGAYFCILVTSDDVLLIHQHLYLLLVLILMCDIVWLWIISVNNSSVGIGDKELNYLSVVLN